ncbi:DUF4136 domain-containing protein [Shewanella profunda]|uniref:DUF4136 domain-containing protein n=1 Tax=Shewanella profunda TaxID=254793 RepID=UPI00200C3AF7|nr:DUF4136 domain-containing protein [Shewanella profunda]MCL1088578.1 DUF4136 domain-containing protein [Shewanella profunda]
MKNPLLNKLGCQLALVFICVLSLTACITVNDNAAQPMRTTVVMSGDLSQLPPSAMTYTWHPQLQKIIVDKRLNQQDALLHMHTVLKQTLQTKGYRWVEDPQLADFQVGFGVAMGTEMTDEQILASVGLVAGLSSHGVNTKKYDKGSILLVFFKPTGVAEQPAEMVWRVLAQGFANIKDMDELTQRFDGLIEEMLLTLPATQAVQ